MKYYSLHLPEGDIPSSKFPEGDIPSSNFPNGYNPKIDLNTEEGVNIRRVILKMFLCYSKVARIGFDIW